eukprot:13827204-Ditylum_brightwellii.AAC.1
MEFKVRENNNHDKIEDIHKSIQTSIADAMGMSIKESTYGVVNDIDHRTDGFYIVKFVFTVYTLQHNELVDNEILKAGSLATDA